MGVHSYLTVREYSLFMPCALEHEEEIQSGDSNNISSNVSGKYGISVLGLDSFLKRSFLYVYDDSSFRVYVQIMYLKVLDKFQE